MASKNVVNLVYLRKVRIIDRIECSWYVYKTYKKRRFLKDIEEGFYSTSSNSNTPLTKKEIEENKDYQSGFIVDGTKVYWFPKVVLEFSNNKSEIKYFKTYEDALEWGNDVIRRGIKNKVEVD